MSDLMFAPQGDIANGTVSQISKMQEGSFSSYASVFDVLVDSSNLANLPVVQLLQIDEANGYIYLVDGYNGSTVGLVIVDLTGKVLSTAKAHGTSGSAPIYTPPDNAASLNYTYALFIGNGNSGITYVVGNKKLLATLDISAEVVAGTAQNAISHTGKYVAMAGRDSTNTKRRRLALWKGS